MTASEHTELLRRDICQALLNAFPMDDKQADAYAAVAAKVALPDGAEPVPVAPSNFEREIHEAIVSRLISLTVGSCSCHTMSPDLKYHTQSCRYRIAAEALELVRPIFASPTGMGVTEE